ncbi:MAG: GAF domain-containing protein [Parcubacteria group bacterium]|jgi:PAS domain S-box-containing protein
MGKKVSVKKRSLLADEARQYQELWENAPVAYHILDTHGIILRVNKTEARMLGYATEEMVGRSIFDFILPAQREDAEQRFRLKLAGKKLVGQSLPRKDERVYVKKDGTQFYVSIQDVLEKDDQGKVVGVRTTMMDITERVRAAEALRTSEQRTQAMNVLLQFSNQVRTKKEYLEIVIEQLKKWSGCAQCGIRILNKEGYIPFDAYSGFTRAFWEAENWLSLKKDQCACVRVIAEKPDPQDRQAMTATGSFYTKNSLQFVAQLAPEARQRFRGECMRCGFASLAVIPIRSKGKVVGAIHLADKKEGLFTPKRMEFMEMLTPLIGEAITKFNSADKLRESNELLQKSQEQLIEAYKHQGVINRKISFLLELEKHQQGKKRAEVVRYILDSAINLARADAGIIYSFDENKDKTCSLVASSGLPKDKQAEAKKLTGKNCPLLKNLVKNPVRLQGAPAEHGVGAAPLAAGIQYFLLLPIMKEKKAKGCIFLEFFRKRSMDTHELEFFDVFSMHASMALVNIGVIK